MKKKFYDIYGKLQISDNDEFSFKSYKSAIQKIDGYIMFDESNEHSTFSSDISGLFTLLPYRRPPEDLKPGFIIASSYVTVRILSKHNSKFIEYIVSLKRFLIVGILASLASFIPAIIYRSALSLIPIPLVMTFFWVFAFPLIYISIPDEFQEFVKKHINSCNDEEKI